MEVVDPNQLGKKKKKAEPQDADFDAEPGADRPSETWKDAQAALLKLTIKEDSSYWNNQLPQLDGFTTSEHNSEYEWDEKRHQYYWRQYIAWKVAYRYYRGNRRRSYIVWPRHVTPSWVAQRILRDHEGIEVLTVKTESGEAQYAYLGEIDFTNNTQEEVYYKRETPVFALWRSTGTIKARKRKSS